jgi:hypothetical protein
MRKMSSVFKVSAFVVASAIVGVGAPAKADTINLGFVLDSSGSITSGGWTTITSGLSAALGAIPFGGPDTYRVSVVSFAYTGQETEIWTGQINNATDISSLQTAVSGASFLNGNTCLSCGTSLVTTAFTNAFGATALDGTKDIINISTDGYPNQGTTNAATLQSAIQAAGWEAVSAEAIGSFDQTFLDNLVYPGVVNITLPGSIPNPLTTGFVLNVNSTADYGPAIQAKVQAIIHEGSEVPLPGALPLFASGLGALGLLGWRRKRKVRAA